MQIFWAPEPSLFEYKDFPEVFPDAETRRTYLAAVARRRASLAKTLDKAEAYGASVYLFMYEPSLPAWTKRSPVLADHPFLAAHPEVKPARRTRWYHPFMCPAKSISKQLLYSKVTNLFHDHPRIGGILLNIGEGHQSLFPCGFRDCAAQSYEDRLVEYCLLLSKAMRAGNPDAKVLLRPWGIFNRGLGSDLGKFRALAEKLPDSVCFWSKVTVPPGSDYLWRDELSPFLGMPRMLFFGWHTHHTNWSQPCAAQLCYTAPRLKDRAVKLAKAGLLGAPSCQGVDRKNAFFEPSRLATTEIGWDPFRFDPAAFLRKWARKRFGEQAGEHVADALKDTWKITDAFIVHPRNTHWCHYLCFVRGRRTSLYQGGSIRQPEHVTNVTEATLPQVLAQFELKEPIAIATAAEGHLRQAVALRPKDRYLLRTWQLSKSTLGLTKLFHEYHTAIVYNNLRLTTKGDKRAHYHRLAAQHIKAAMPQLAEYLKWMYELYPDLARVFDKVEHTWSDSRRWTRTVITSSIRWPPRASRHRTDTPAWSWSRCGRHDTRICSGRSQASTPRSATNATRPTPKTCSGSTSSRGSRRSGRPAKPCSTWTSKPRRICPR